MATVANGFIGHVVYGENIYVNGVYNGAAGVSHRARIPSTCALNLTVNGYEDDDLQSLYALDVGKGLSVLIMAYYYFLLCLRAQKEYF